MDAAERFSRSQAAGELVDQLAERGVSGVATTFVDNSGITRVKAFPLSKLPQVASWGWESRRASTVSAPMTSSPAPGAVRSRWETCESCRTCGA